MLNPVVYAKIYAALEKRASDDDIKAAFNAVNKAKNPDAKAIADEGVAGGKGVFQSAYVDPAVDASKAVGNAITSRYDTSSLKDAVDDINGAALTDASNLMPSESARRTDSLKNMQKILVNARKKLQGKNTAERVSAEAFGNGVMSGGGRPVVDIPTPTETPASLQDIISKHMSTTEATNQVAADSKGNAAVAGLLMATNPLKKMGDISAGVASSKKALDTDITAKSRPMTALETLLDKAKGGMKAVGKAWDGLSPETQKGIKLGGVGLLAAGGTIAAIKAFNSNKKKKHRVEVED